jgi:hypothetical protein
LIVSAGTYGSAAATTGRHELRGYSPGLTRPEGRSCDDYRMLCTVDDEPPLILVVDADRGAIYR